MAVECRKACASRHVPDFDGLVVAAGDKLAVGRKSHKVDAALWDESAHETHRQMPVLASVE